MERDEPSTCEVYRKSLVYAIEDYHGCREHRLYYAEDLLRSEIRECLKVLNGMAGEW